MTAWSFTLHHRQKSCQKNLSKGQLKHQSPDMCQINHRSIDQNRLQKRLLLLNRRWMRRQLRKLLNVLFIQKSTERKRHRHRCRPQSGYTARQIVNIVNEPSRKSYKKIWRLLSVPFNRRFTPSHLITFQFMKGPLRF